MRSFVTIAVVMMAGVAVAMAEGYGSSGYGSGGSYMSYPGYGGYSSGYGSGYGYGGGYGGYGGGYGSGYGKGYGKKQSTHVYYPVPVPVQQPSAAPLPLPPIGLDTAIDTTGNNGIFGGNGGLGLLGK